MLLELLAGEEPGFYVDVGSFHPRWGSNTYALYRRRWSGINIDARPGSMKAFRRIRKRDVNLEVGVGSATGTLDFHVFADDELCTFDSDLAVARRVNHRQIASVPIEVRTLSSVIEQYQPGGIDLLLVDVEGLDVEVLRSNDWERYRPRLVVVEALSDPDRIVSSEVVTFMGSVGYAVVAATAMNLFFEAIGGDRRVIR